MAITRLFSLPDDLRTNISLPVDDQTLLNVAITSKEHTKFFDTIFLERGAKKLIQHISSASWEAVKEVAARNFRLMFHEVPVQKLDGTTEKMTPIQYCCYLLDPYSLNIFFNCTPRNKLNLFVAQQNQREIKPSNIEKPKEVFRGFFKLLADHAPNHQLNNYWCQTLGPMYVNCIPLNFIKEIIQPEYPKTTRFNVHKPPQDNLVHDFRRRPRDRQTVLFSSILPDLYSGQVGLGWIGAMGYAVSTNYLNNVTEDCESVRDVYAARPEQIAQIFNSARHLTQEAQSAGPGFDGSRGKFGR